MSVDPLAPYLENAKTGDVSHRALCWSTLDRVHDLYQDWVGMVKLGSRDSLLDIGSGVGLLEKFLYRVANRHHGILYTGVEPVEEFYLEHAGCALSGELALALFPEPANVGPDYMGRKYDHVTIFGTFATLTDMQAVAMLAAALPLATRSIAVSVLDPEIYTGRLRTQSPAHVAAFMAGRGWRPWVLRRPVAQDYLIVGIR